MLAAQLAPRRDTCRKHEGRPRAWPVPTTTPGAANAGMHASGTHCCLVLPLRRACSHLGLQNRHHKNGLTGGDVGGTNLLRDAACLAILHIGAPDVVQNLGLACMSILWAPGGEGPQPATRQSRMAVSEERGCFRGRHQPPASQTEHCS